MSAKVQMTHTSPSTFFIIIRRKQGAQGLESDEFLPEELDCNAGDGMVETEDASSECSA